MQQNEFQMLLKGQKRVWSSIFTKQGNLKDIASMQLGQKLIVKESQKITPLISTWINNKIANIYCQEFKAYFRNDDIILEKIVQTSVLLAGQLYYDYSYGKGWRSTHVDRTVRLVTPELKFEIAWQFLEAVVELQPFFERNLEYDNSRSKHKKLSYRCTLSENIMNDLTYQSAIAFYAQPMLVPPLDWKIVDGKSVGGYEEKQFDLIRAGSFRPDYSKVGQPVLDAINYIQSQPWKLNLPVLRKVSDNLKIPLKSDFCKTEYPERDDDLFKLDIEDSKVLKKLGQAGLFTLKNKRADFMNTMELYQAERFDYESAVGKYRAIELAIKVAKGYEDKIFYLPHSFDFRGRVYPISIGLQPQGSDSIKAMLEYAHGEVLNEDGIKWAWAYLASLFGDDKIPFTERIERGKELIDTSYLEADEPYQFLAHQNELKRWLVDKKYEFKGRVHLDACNSGSQFASGITGDITGAYATNVITTRNEEGEIERQDAYMLVADKAVALTSKMIKKADGPIKRKELEFIKDLLIKNGRKICKEPVMVSNYGGTPGGRMNILWGYLREEKVEKKFLTKKIAGLMAKIIGESIQGVLTGGKAFEQYIHKMNGLLVKGGQPITWNTDDGFHVVHTKHKFIKRTISVQLPGARKKTTMQISKFTDDLDGQKMKLAISPNYIHSLDAELVRKVALRMKDDGIKYSDWIHDSFGCHPNYVSKMLVITKEEFLALLRRKPLDILHKELMEQMPNVKRKRGAIPRVPRLKQFDVDSDNQDLVILSDWFFS